jgi:uncharacterized membrane protein HdeD (DUF308 family)
VIILGLVLLVVGFVAKIAILWTLGIVVLVVGRHPDAARRRRPRDRWSPALLLTLT